MAHTKSRSAKSNWLRNDKKLACVFNDECSDIWKMFPYLFFYMILYRFLNSAELKCNNLRASHGMRDFVYNNRCLFENFQFLLKINLKIRKVS